MPFIIAITGHRDAAHCNNKEENQKGITLSIKECIMSWSDIVGNNTPIWLFSGMAEGADLLAVEAMELACNDLTHKGWDTSEWKIIPCLPMKKEFYEMDFSNKNSTFNEKISKYKENTLTLTHHGLSKEQHDKAEEAYNEHRDEMYLNLGAFLARHANVILAVWDGHDSEGTGGTADVVKLKLGIDGPLKGTSIAKSLHLPRDFDGQVGGVVQHIPCTRTKESQKEEIASHLTQLDINSPTFKNHQKTLKKYRIYSTYDHTNTRETRFKKLLQEEFENLINRLAFYNKTISQKDFSFKLKEKGKANSLKGCYSSTGLDESYTQFEAADEAAIFFQKKYRSKLLRFFLATLTMLLSYEFVGYFITKGKEGSIVNIVVFFAASISLYLLNQAKKNRWKEKYILSRGVAEAIRFRGYLNLAKLSPSRYFMVPRKYRVEMPLMTQAVRVCEIDWWRNENKPHQKSSLDLVKSEWLEKQTKFFDDRLSLSIYQKEDKKNWREYNIGKKISLTLKAIREIPYKRPRLMEKYLYKTSEKLIFSSGLFGIALLISKFEFDAKLISPDGFNSLFFNHSPIILIFLVQLPLILSGILALWKRLAGYKSIASGYDIIRELYERALDTLEKHERKYNESANSTYADHESYMERGEGRALQYMFRNLAFESMQEHCEWHLNESENSLRSQKLAGS